MHLRQAIYMVLFLAATIASRAQQQPHKTNTMTRAHFTREGELVVIPSASSQSTDFDFLAGSHNVHHRTLKNRLANSEEWTEFEGLHQQELLLKGRGNLEKHQLPGTDGKMVEAIALRLFNPQTKLWSIYWANSNTAVLDPPVVGSFENKIGHFYAKDTWEGKPVLVQFVWDARDEMKFQWSQAFSTDNGKTWEWNWYMTFAKAPVRASVSKQEQNENISIIELRNYLLKEGKRDKFIEYFEQNLVTAQAEQGGFPIGQYRIENEPDRCCWVRAFANMQTRSRFLPSFYYGNHWKKHRSIINETIVNSDRVHLLHSLILQNDTLVPASIDPASLHSFGRIAVIDFYTANTRQNQLKQFFAKKYIPFLHSCDIRDFTVWESELSENDFPRLPVFQDKDLLVIISFFKDEKDYAEKKRQLALKAGEELKAELLDLVTVKSTMILKPTVFTTHLKSNPVGAGNLQNFIHK